IDVSEIRMPAANEKIQFIALRVVAAGGRDMQDGDQKGHKPNDGLASVRSRNGLAQRHCRKSMTADASAIRGISTFIATLRLSELDNHRVDSDAVARLDADFLDRAVALGAQNILHLHRLDHRQRLAGLDLLAFGDGNRNDK